MKKKLLNRIADGILGKDAIPCLGKRLFRKEELPKSGISILTGKLK
jgi:hypothetical protein